MLAHTQFGTKTTLTPSILRPKAHFGPKNTSAPLILQPRNNTAQKLWLNTLRPEDQIFKSVIFNQFVHYIGLEGAWQRPKIKVIKSKSFYALEKGFSIVDQPGSGLLIDFISQIGFRLVAMQDTNWFIRD